MLSREIASDIVEQTTIRLKRNINIMDETGVIIASANPERINQIHYAAIEVLRTGKTIVIDNKASSEWGNSLPGINLPIEFEQQIIGVIGITGNPQSLLEFGELIKMNTEMMIKQAFMVEQLEWKQRLKDLIFDHLKKNVINPKQIQQRLELLNLTLHAPYQVSIIQIHSEKILRGQTIEILEQIFNHNKTLIGFLKGNQLYILNSSVSNEVIKQKMKEAIVLLDKKGLPARVSMGTNVNSLDLIQLSYHEAVISLTLGNQHQSLIEYAEVKTKALLNNVEKETKQLYYERILGDLSDKWIDTLEHFFTCNLNIAECAKDMYIHRNSLIYRIKKIKEISGYDPQKFEDAIQLQLAVWLKRMVEAPLHKKE
ncbi:hypothetical protein BTS2_2932 [Bacillus sp. TS-2]|nr:hypothetical protein BTS2_2932 [Bacillus sp. TS-2]